MGGGGGPFSTEEVAIPQTLSSSLSPSAFFISFCYYEWVGVALCSAS
jgi:hypothetical protein